MIILDTNVLSVMMAAAPEARVTAWLKAQPSADLFTAAVCQAEILSGLAIMPTGRRRTALEAAARVVFRKELSGRVLAFDTAAAILYADLFAMRRRIGRPTGKNDLMIAAIARVHGATVATRNIADFAGCGVVLVNPWA